MYKIEKGHKVILFFRNGMSYEGFVEYWSDEHSVIRSLKSPNLLIIQNTKADVSAIKIIMEVEQDAHHQSQPQPQPQPMQAESIRDEPELKAYEPDTRLRALKLAELKRELIDEEKRLVVESLSTFKASDTTGSFIYDNRIRKL